MAFGSETKTASERDDYPMLPSPVGPLHFGWHVRMALHLVIGSKHFISQVTWFGSHRHEISCCKLKLQMRLFVVGTKALARNKTNHLIWGNCILFTLFGTPFICHQQDFHSDVGMPPTREKGSHLPPGTPKLGELRDGHDSATVPTAKPDLGSSSLLGGCWSVEPNQGCQKCDSSSGDGTGTLDGLVGSHTRLAVYPALAIHYHRVVIHASLDTRFKGEVSSDLPGYHQTTKVTLTEGSPERSGYMHMDKQVTHSILDMLFSMRGTETGKVEGLWLINRPKHLVPEYPDDSPEVWWCSPFIVPSLCSTRHPHDIMNWHHDHLLWSSSGKTTAHAHQNCQHSCAHLLASSPEPPNTTNASEPLRLFLNPIFVPVTYILGKGKIYNKLSISITTMVLKRLNFSCPTNRKIDACMGKEKKFQNSGQNQINKTGLLSVPKLITVEEGIPTPNDIIGCSHDIISGGNPAINKLKYQLELIYVYKSADSWYWHNWYLHEWPVLFTVHLTWKLKI